MGKKLDALLGRSFKTSKFKALLNLAVSRLAILKNQKQTRSSVARSDVVQLLNLGQQDRALLRVEQVIKEQNMVDVYSMIDSYCLLLSERVKLIEHDNRECPDELKEAISSLIFAASRCGEFPELQEIRSVFTSRYGKDFTSRAVELRNNCGVNPKIIQKLSTRLPSLEVRIKVLKEIATENGIALQLPEEASAVATEERMNREEGNQHKHKSFSSNNVESAGGGFLGGVDQVEGLSTSSMNTRREYKDVADAAHAAFISAAYAAAAARAAVELSKPSPRAPDDSNEQNEQIFNSNYGSKSVAEKGKYSVENEDHLLKDDKVNSFNKYSFNSDDKETIERVGSPLIKQTKQEEQRENSPVTSPRIFGKDEKLPQEEVMFDHSDVEDKSEKLSSIADENPWGGTVPYFSPKRTHSTLSHVSRAGRNSESLGGLAVNAPLKLNFGRPVSVRTRR